MPTLIQAAEWYRQEILKGKGHLHTGHPYIAEEEAKKREEGAPDAEGKPKTKIAWESSDPEAYKEWHKERRRWMDACGSDPTTSTQAMIVALKAYSPEGIHAILEVLGEQVPDSSTGPAPPRAEIPSGLGAAR